MAKKKESFFESWDKMIKNIDIPRIKKSIPKHKPFAKWGAVEYDIAADAVAKAMKLTSVERARIRYAIRQEVEKNS